MITSTKTKSLNIKTSFINKQILIKIAKDGKDKPKWNTKEAQALRDYLYKFSSSYDKSFAKLIKKLRQDWFAKNSDVMKQKLIQMARSGKSRPSSRTKDGMLLISYVRRLSSSYDESFNKKIRKLRPDWFAKNSDVMKQKLIQMAKNGESRPRHTTKLGQCLSRYINKSSGCYDESFDKLIRKLRPDWFVRSSDLNKQILIKMAKSGSARPTGGTKEGVRLIKYTNKSSSSYDESFTKQIRKLRPDWFVSRSQIATQKKQELIRMAKSGETRPICDKTKIGQALSNYTNKSSQTYDSMFNKQIRKLRPDWFKR